MIFYLIFDHYYSGIIQSQVIDVVQELEAEKKLRFKIIAFVNLKRFREAKKSYKENAGRVIVLPNFGFSKWNWSFPLLLLYALFYKPKTCIGRSVFANQLALLLKKFQLTQEAVLDARGAEFAEWSEYFFKEDNGPVSLEEIKRLEKESVERSDRILSVSSKLIEYWQSIINAKFDLIKVSIISSTVSNEFHFDRTKVDVRNSIRERMKLEDSDILIVFSGSKSDWHALNQVLRFCENLTVKFPNAQFLFLTNAIIDLSEYKNLKKVITQLWLIQSEVPDYLFASDYALLLRNNSWTNMVSSPVKLSEYVTCGCKVLISSQIGDLSDLVKKERLGEVIDNWTIPENIRPILLQERCRVADVGYELFSKKDNLKAYNKTYIGKE